METLLRMMGRDPEAERERFGSFDLRRQHEQELDSAVAQWIGTQESAPLLDALVRAGIPAAPVNDIAALFADPHVRARGSFATVGPNPRPLTSSAGDAPSRLTPPHIRSTGRTSARTTLDHRGELFLTTDALAELRTRIIRQRSL